MPNSLERLAHELGRGLGAVNALNSAVDGPRALLASLGWDLPAGAHDIGLASLDLSELANKLGSLDLDLSVGTGGASVDAKYADVFAALLDSLTHLKAFAGAVSAPGDYVSKTHIDTELVPRLTSVLIVARLAAISPFALLVFQLCGVITFEQFAADPAVYQLAHARPIVHWDALGRLFTDPLGLLGSHYRWGTAQFDPMALVANISALAEVIGAPVRLRLLPRRVEEQLAGISVPEAGVLPATQLIASFLRGHEASGLDVGISVYPLRPTAAGGTDGGIALSPFVHGSSDLHFPLADRLTLEFQTHLALDSGVALQIRPHAPVALKTGLLKPGGAAAGGALVVLTYGSAPGSPLTLLSLPGGGRLEAGSITIGGGVDVAGGVLTQTLVARLAGGHISLQLGGEDSFLASILPAGGIDAHFDAGLRWSAKEGFSFEGSASGGVDFPVHLSIGGVDIEWMHVGLAASSAGLPIELSVTGRGALGPLKASVERVGVLLNVAFHDGNLGPVDLGVGFKAPTGVGLSLDAGVVSGGGFLYIDTDRGQYAGALALTFAGFLDLSAIGLINTKMPDGSAGFSLLVIITADFGAGIQLGFGFTLNAVGGLLGLNRKMLFGPLMDGVRSGAIESIMFPRDVVANAPRIISDLNAIFPPQEGTFLIGPMAKLGWGEPTLVSLSLGVIIEIPPGDIAILGVLKLALPTEDAAILLLQVNFAGALEFDKQRMYFFASLFDSHILFITIEGEMGLLFAWGDNANFVVSIGGFHPQFSPPPLPFPSPRRIEVDIINESFARIRCDGYFAVTTNTAQFGAHAEYFFGFSACSVEGHSGFDALIQFSPFHFTVSVSTSFSVKVFGAGMFGIDINITVEGPTPWHAKGSGSLTFLFFSVDIPIDITWGDSRDTSLPPVQVMPIIAGELGKQSNWKAALPSGSNLLVSLRKLDASEAEHVLHPVGTLQISQRAVPLDLTIDKVGNQKPQDAKRFTLTAASPDLVKRRDLDESFAPAQFKDFDDAGRLSQAAYAPQHGGIELSAAGELYRTGTAITRVVRYDLSIIDSKLRRRRWRFFTLSGDLFGHLLLGSSVARSSLSAFREAQTHPFEGTVAVAAERFVVAHRASNTAFSAEASFSSQAAANDHLDRLLAQDSSLQGGLHVLPAFEVAA